MRIIIRQLDHKNAIGLWLYDERNGQHLVAEPAVLTLKPIPESYMLPEPTFEIRSYESQQLFQSLINALIEQGIRPDNDKVAGLLEAQTKHLEDMRKLVFK